MKKTINVKTESVESEFEQLSRKLIKYLCENHHPHTTILISPTGAEIVEGVKAFYTEEYLVD